MCPVSLGAARPHPQLTREAWSPPSPGRREGRRHLRLEKGVLCPLGRPAGQQQQRGAGGGVLWHVAPLTVPGSQPPARLGRGNRADGTFQKRALGKALSPEVPPVFTRGRFGPGAASLPAPGPGTRFQNKRTELAGTPRDRPVSGCLRLRGLPAPGGARACRPLYCHCTGLAQTLHPRLDLGPEGGPGRGSGYLSQAQPPSGPCPLRPTPG